jgi:hypothetical protein
MLNPMIQEPGSGLTEKIIGIAINVRRKHRRCCFGDRSWV